jgi:hypothetical protein
MMGKQWQDKTQRPELMEGKAPRTAPNAPSQRPPSPAHHQPMRQISCRTSPRPPLEPGAPPQVHPRGGRLFRQDPQHLHEQTPVPQHPPTPASGLASSVTQVCPCSPQTSTVETKMGRNEETQSEPGVHTQAFFLFFFKLTRNGTGHSSRPKP